MSKQNYDLIVIGAGPGGYVAAIRAAQLGMKVACVEKHSSLGGTCLNVGCIPSKALLESSERFSQAQHSAGEHGIVMEKLSLDFSKMMSRKEEVVKKLTQGVAHLFKKNKIDSHQGVATIVEPGKVSVKSEQGSTEITGKNILVATGSEPITLPNLAVDQKSILDSTGALALAEVPNKLVVVGGGYIGLELGSVYLRLGSEVTVVEMLDRLIPGMDLELAKEIHKSLKKQGMAFKLKTKVLKGSSKQGGGVQLDLEGQEAKEQLSADAVLVAVGRRPLSKGLGLEDLEIEVDEKGRVVVDDHYQSSQEGIYAIGDVIRGPMLAHKAMEEGVAVAEHLAGQRGGVHYPSIPSVVYTWPEIASVGLHEEELKALNLGYKKAKFPFRANGRALSLGETEGWVKLLSLEKNDRLVGAHIFGPRASDMVAELVLALAQGLTASELAQTIHAHPTLAETVKEAALGLGDGAIHS